MGDEWVPEVGDKAAVVWTPNGSMRDQATVTTIERVTKTRVTTTEGIHFKRPDLTNRGGTWDPMRYLVRRNDSRALAAFTDQRLRASIDVLNRAVDEWRRHPTSHDKATDVEDACRQALAYLRRTSDP